MAIQIKSAESTSGEERSVVCGYIEFFSVRLQITTLSVCRRKACMYCGAIFPFPMRANFILVYKADTVRLYDTLH